MPDPNENYLIGIDMGTQSAKVLVFDTDGNIVSQGRHPLRRLEIPAPLLAEHPDDDLWDSLKKAVRTAMRQFQDQAGRNPADITAAGICIIRCCRALLDGNGRLTYPVINWMDKRLNDPYQYDAAYGDVRYVTTASGYITHRLTGEFRDTGANYLGWWPIDNETSDWCQDTQVFEDCGIPREMLFEVVPPGTVLGTVTAAAAESTGLPVGLPVVATAHDKAVEALGAGALPSGAALISLGTYIGAMVHGWDYIPDARHFWSFPAAIPGRYLYECMGVRRGMWTISWFCQQFGDGLSGAAAESRQPVEAVFEQEARQVPAGCDGLLTVHDWAPPVEAVFRKGVMIGFDGRHTRAHMYRSLLEGIAFTLKNHMDPMADELGQPLEQLIISGGGAASDLFMQIFADIFGLPARRGGINGPAAVGSAINAGMATGVFDSYQHAIQRMTRSGEDFSPDPAHHDFYSRLNREVYRHAHRHFDPFLKQLSPLVDSRRT